MIKAQIQEIGKSIQLYFMRSDFLTRASSQGEHFATIEEQYICNICTIYAIATIEENIVLGQTLSRAAGISRRLLIPPPHEKRKRQSTFVHGLLSLGWAKSVI